jgi:hypothetical protein
MAFQLIPQVGVARNLQVTSNILTMTDLAGAVNVEIGYGGTPNDMNSAVLLINGVASGTFATVNNGDTIAVRGNSINAYDSTAFATVVFLNYATSVFAVRTIQDPATIALDGSFEDVPPSGFFDAYTPVTPDNKFLSLNPTNNSVSSTNIAIVGSADPSTIGDGLDYVYAADMIADKVHRINPSTGLVVQSLTINNPFGVAYTPTSSNSNSAVTHAVISSPEDNQVHIIDGGTQDIIRTASVGSGPHGVAGAHSAAIGNYSFWVCCTDSDRVEFWTYTNGITLAREFYYDLEAGAKPFGIDIDSAGDAWVTCLGTDKLVHLPSGGGGSVAYTSLPDIDPWAIVIDLGHAYIACAGSDKVNVVNLTTKAVTQLTVISNPTELAIANSRLFVGSFNFGTLYSYPLNSVTSIGSGTAITSQRMVEGLETSSVGDAVYALNLHNDSPIRTALPDLTPDPMVFPSVVNVLPSDPVDSDTITVNGVDDGPANLVIPSLYGADLVVNSSSAGTDENVTDGDTISISLTAPAQSQEIYIPILSAGSFTTFVISMEPGANPRVAGWMQGG